MAKIKDIMNDKAGSMIVSVLLGLGLAALFRRACHGDGCVVVKAPSLAEVRKNTYQMGTSCYKYTPHEAACPLSQKP